jgi:triacylglycerol lipase
MPPLTKINVSGDSKFDRTRSIELANLIERAYRQFDHRLELKGNPLFGSTAVQPRKDNTPDELDVDNSQPVQYNVLDTFSYTGFFLGVPKEVPFGFIAQRQDKPTEIFVVFRGTRTEAEWFNNAQYDQTPFLGNRDLGLVSRGFHKIYTRPKPKQEENLVESLIAISPPVPVLGSIRYTIVETLKQCPEDSQVFVTGHSLGSALAALATLDIALLGHFQLPPTLYTFASPRTGDSTFVNQFERHKIDCFRIANSEDIVTTVPPSAGRVIGDEMLAGLTDSRRNTLEFLLNVSRSFEDGFFNTEYLYQHLGEPIYFTDQKGSVSFNHNMFRTYREALIL